MALGGGDDDCAVVTPSLDPFAGAREAILPTLPESLSLLVSLEMPVEKETRLGGGHGVTIRPSE